MGYLTFPSDLLALLGDGCDTSLHKNLSDFTELRMSNRSSNDDERQVFHDFNGKSITRFEWSARLVSVIESLSKDGVIESLIEEFAELVVAKGVETLTLWCENLDADTDFHSAGPLDQHKEIYFNHGELRMADLPVELQHAA
jgi:hypothetical protein